MAIRLPIELWIRIALAAGQDTDEHVFNALVRALPGLGRWTAAAEAIGSSIVSRRLDLMLMFGYSVELTSQIVDVYEIWDDIEMGNASYASYGCIVWKKNGQIHRNDGSATVGVMGDLCVYDEDYVVRYSWQYHGRLHRVDGPSGECFDLSQTWSRYGEFYRADGPAVISGTSTFEWYLGADLHRTDGPAMIASNGEIEWCNDGEHHRIDGPAFIWGDGVCEFLQNGKEVPQ